MTPRVARSFSQSETMKRPRRRALHAKRSDYRRLASAVFKGRKNSPLGEQLRAWRKRLDLSQSMAANKLKISKRTLQNWEQGHRRPRGFALDQLREKLR